MEPKPKNATAEKYYGPVMQRVWPEFVRKAREQGVSLKDVAYEAHNADTYGDGDRGKLCLSITGSSILYQLDEVSLDDPVARQEEIAKFLAVADLPKVDPPNGGFRSLVIDPRLDPPTKHLVMQAIPDLRYELGTAATSAAVEWTRAEVEGQPRIRLTLSGLDQNRIRATDTFVPSDFSNPAILSRRFSKLWSDLLSAISRQQLASLRESLSHQGAE